MFIGVIVLPELVTYTNAVPKNDQLEKHQVTIVSTHKNDPHFVMEMEDGTRRMMEWPVTVSYHGGFPSDVWSDEHRKNLPGCRAEIHGLPMRWTTRDRYRVWALNCPDKEIQIPMDLVVKDYQLSLNARRSGWFVPLACLVLLLTLFIQECKGNYIEGEKVMNESIHQNILIVTNIFIIGDRPRLWHCRTR